MRYPSSLLRVGLGSSYNKRLSGQRVGVNQGANLSKLGHKGGGKEEGLDSHGRVEVWPFK